MFFPLIISFVWVNTMPNLMVYIQMIRISWVENLGMKLDYIESWNLINPRKRRLININIPTTELENKINILLGSVLILGSPRVVNTLAELVVLFKSRTKTCPLNNYRTLYWMAWLLSMDWLLVGWTWVWSLNSSSLNARLCGASTYFF